MIDLDRFIIGFDRTLRTLFAPAMSARPTPGEDLPESEMDAATREHAAALMRVNHTGEICAQALYQGQALTARNPGRAASGSVVQILILPGVAWVAIWLLAALAAMRGGDLPSGKIMLGLWYGLGLAADIFFGATARHKLLTQFRLMAEQRFTPRAGFWQRLFSAGK